MPERAHIGLGSNLSDRRSYLAAGLAAVVVAAVVAAAGAGAAEANNAAEANRRM